MGTLTPDVYVHLVDFGITSADEVVRENSDGSYTILLNSRQASNRLHEAYNHAMEHILSGDLDNDHLNVQKIESIRHGIDTAKDKPMRATDWEKLMKAAEKGKKASLILNRYNLSDYISLRLEMVSDAVSDAENHYLEAL